MSMIMNKRIYITTAWRRVMLTFPGLKGCVIVVITLLPARLPAQNNSSNQPRTITLQQAIEEALKNNSGIKSASYAIDLQKALRGSALNMEKTTITLTQGQLNSPNYDNNVSINQRIEYPTVYKNQLRLADERIKGSQYQLAVNQLELVNNVKSAYYQFVYFINKRQLLFAQDTLYANLLKASIVRHRTGESTLLEKATSETQSQEIKNRIQQNEMDIVIAQQQLQVLLHTKDAITVSDTSVVKRELQLPTDSTAIANNPTLRYLQQQIEINKKETDVQKAKRLPDFIVGYTNQSFRGIQNINGVIENYTGIDRFNSFQVGVAIPLLPGGYKSKITAAKVNEQIAASRLQYEHTVLHGQLNVLLQQYYKHKSAIIYYEATALPQADLIIKNADRGFRAGELTYTQYQQSLATALKIKTDYIEAIYQYNQSTLAIESIAGIK
jgi:heavy metal efflux system protein